MQTSAVSTRDPSGPTLDAPEPDRFASIAIAAITPSPLNPCRHFDDDYIKQLADSMLTHGVIEPLVVRQTSESGPQKFELIAGECRLRAAKKACLEHVPAMVKTLTDDEALEVRLIENVQRRGLMPLEEAYGYRALIDSNPQKHSAESIARRLGLSPKYVWDRMKLLDLVPAAKSLLDEERINAGHAILIARQTPGDQQRIIAPDSNFWEREHTLEFDDEVRKKPGKYDGAKPMSVRELERWIAEHIRFDVTAQARAAPLEFGTVHEAVQERLAQPGRGKKVVRITFDHFVKPDARDEHDRTFGPQSWKRADGGHQSKTCPYSVLGVVAVGPGYGTAFDVCIAKDQCEVHWKAERAVREKRAKQREQGGSTSDAGVRAREREEQQRAKDEAARAAWERAKPALLEACAAKLKNAKVSIIGNYVIDAIATRAAIKGAWALVGPPKTADDFLRLAALIELAEQIDDYRANVEFPKLVKQFGVNVAAVLKTQVKEKSA